MHSIPSCDQFLLSPRCHFKIPDFPTVVSHYDRQNGNGCFGSRPSSSVIGTHHDSGAWFVNHGCWWNLVPCDDDSGCFNSLTVAETVFTVLLKIVELECQRSTESNEG